jgi:hypothetical protein
MKSDAQLMNISLADLLDKASTVLDRQRALQELLELVEPIDNALGIIPQSFCKVGVRFRWRSF